MTTTEIPPTGVDPADSGAPQVNPAADCEANRTKNFATRPMTGDEYISSCRTVARSGFTVIASRTSRHTPRSGIRSA